MRNSMSAFVPIQYSTKYAAITTPITRNTRNLKAMMPLDEVGMYSFSNFSGDSNDMHSFLIASDTVSPVGEMKTFEAVAPDLSTLVGFGVVLVLSVIASFVWANEVVPVSRTKLALSKRDGEVKEYLEGLKEEPLANAGIETIETEGLDADSSVRRAKEVEIKPNVGDGRDVERWLFSDWLNDNKSAGGKGRKKEPALPILKKAKWNSGDNPVLVTAGIMMVGIVIASITERV